MFARLLALCCLVNPVVSLRAASTEPAPSPLIVYLVNSAGQPVHPLEFMKRELSQLMRSAGYRVEWLDARAEARGSGAAALAVVELRGSCGMPAGSFSAEPSAVTGDSLAFSSTSEGRILPFSQLNCETLTRVVGPSLAAEPGARRDFLYGRAMARLLAHELYHVLLNTGGHAAEGVAKPAFTPTDLLTERFEFEPGTVALLQQRPSAQAADEPASGR